MKKGKRCKISSKNDNGKSCEKSKSVLYSKKSKSKGFVHGERFGMKLKNISLKHICIFLLFILVTIGFNSIITYFSANDGRSNYFEIAGADTIVFDSNGGTGTMANQTILPWLLTNLSSNVFTRGGYVFAGWNTSADGTGTPYTDGQVVTNPGNITLYAQWKHQGVKYAVQIYGIGQDETSNDNLRLALTFGPATGADYNNSYVTHTYEETSAGSGTYYVKIVTHTVAANGTETTSERYLTNSSGNNVTRTTAEKNKYDINMHNMTWAGIAAVSDKTAFKDCMLCGDTKSVELSLNSTISAENEYNQFGDGAGILYNAIDSNYLKWNNTTNNDRSVGAYASSRIRATLVGKDSSTNTAYAGDDALSSDVSLYSCIPSDLRNVIEVKKVKYATGTSASSYSSNEVYDKIWLLSERELCCKATNGGKETEGIGTSGLPYERFTNEESAYYISDSPVDTASDNRKCYHEDNSTFVWWLRTTNITRTNLSRVMNNNGIPDNRSTSTSEGIGFGFCIGTVEPDPVVKYAVQIYGIGQDVASDGVTNLALTFGPATGEDYNDKYVTHTYEETSSGSGSYYVKIVTHTVASNGTETTSEEYLTNSSGNRVVRTTAEKNRYDINLHNMTWTQIAEATDKRAFKDCMLCGDTKSVELTLNSEIKGTWKESQYGDGAGSLYNAIGTYYRKWNPSSSENSAATNGGQYGSNAKNAGAYKTSHVRATLVGADISNPTVSYAGDKNLSSLTCLYSCIQSDLSSVIIPKKIKYVTGTSKSSYTQNSDIADPIWLFSDREMYGTGEDCGNTAEGLGTNGVGYNKFADSESKYYISSYTDIKELLTSRDLYNNDCSPYTYWLRSVNLNNDNNSQNIYVRNGNRSFSCFHDLDIAFGFCIGTIEPEPEPEPDVKYAVQIYGINQDVDSSGNTLGLTFGPATGANYNNSYVTHRYEETSAGSGSYYVKIVTHEVDSNGAESTTEEYLKNSSGNNVTRTTAEKNKYDINLHNMTWAEISAVSDKTAFKDCMLCGDTKSVELNLNSTIKASSVSNQYGDGAGMLYSTINSYYRRWNPSQSDNSYVGTGVTLDSNEENSGSNARNAGGYSSSHIRATLIGKENATAIGGSTTLINEGYAGNVNLSGDTCLYSCIQSDLKSVITPKKINYVTGTGTSSYTQNSDIADSIWLFSEREIYSTASVSGTTAEGLGSSGVGYARFSDTESRYYMSSYSTSSTANRTVYYEAGSAVSWWVRSPYLNDVGSLHYVNSNGDVSYVWFPYSSNGLALGFCIR